MAASIARSNVDCPFDLGSIVTGALARRVEEMLLLNGLEPLHWSIAGGLLGVITLALLFVENRALGISTGFESVCALTSRRPYFARAELHGPGAWRLPFLAGLLAAGALSSALSGAFASGASPTWTVGLLDVTIGAGALGKVAWMFAGGLLIGFGTRLAGGCTSGHGIFGVSNFEKSSLVAMVAFMAAGVLATQVFYRVVVR